MKFKSYDEKYKQFIYFLNGYYYKYQECKEVIEVIELSEDFECFLRKSTFWKNAKQSIELKDKNDNEIYDGDTLNVGLFAFNDEKFGITPWNNLPDNVDKNDLTTIIGVIKVEFPDNYFQIKDRIESNPDVVGVEVKDEE